MTPEGFWPDELSVKQVEAERLRRDKKNIRNQIIEECAKVADGYRNVQLEWIKADAPERIAAAIRALRDKP